MRLSSRTIRRLTVGTVVLAAVVGLAAFGVGTLSSSAGGSVAPHRHASTSTTASTTSTVPTTATTSAFPAATTTTTTAAVAVLPTAPMFNTGNAQLDALLPTLPAVLFEGGAQVHYGYNPVDCCHAGGYNPDPNEVWVGPNAFSSPERLTYVTVHELAHSVHLKSSRSDALTAAVAGAPVVRPGSPWDDSEKVADCVAWALYADAAAGSGITYWDCPDPWRARVVDALR